MSLLLAAGIGAATGLIQTGIGLFNRRKGNDAYDKLMANQPKFEIPSGVLGAVNTAAAAYQGGLPTYDIAEQNIAATTSRGVDVAERSAGSGQELQGTTQALFARELESLNQLNVQDIQYRDAARKDYMNALFSKGQYEAQAQEQRFNVWQMKLNREAERAGYGQQMLQQGIGGVIGAVGQGIAAYSNMSQLRAMMPQEGVGSTLNLNNINPTLKGNYNFYDPSTWGASSGLTTYKPINLNF